MSDEAKQVIAKIAQAAQAIGWQAGVGAMETAGSIVSYLAAHPEQIEPFLTDKVSPIDWPIGWHTHGCLTWHGMDGKIYSPEFARRCETIKKLQTGDAA